MKHLCLLISEDSSASKVDDLKINTKGQLIGMAREVNQTSKAIPLSLSLDYFSEGKIFSPFQNLGIQRLP